MAAGDTNVLQYSQRASRGICKWWHLSKKCPKNIPQNWPIGVDRLEIGIARGSALINGLLKQEPRLASGQIRAERKPASLSPRERPGKSPGLFIVCRAYSTVRG